MPRAGKHVQVAELNHVAPRQVLHHRQQHVFDLLAIPTSALLVIPGGLRVAQETSGNHAA